MTLLRKCGTNTLLRKCGTNTLLIGCPYGDPCNYCPDGILPARYTVVVSGITYCCISFAPSSYSIKYSILTPTFELTQVVGVPCRFYGYEADSADATDYDTVDCTAPEHGIPEVGYVQGTLTILAANTAKLTLEWPAIFSAPYGKFFEATINNFSCLGANVFNNELLCDAINSGGNVKLGTGGTVTVTPW